MMRLSTFLAVLLVALVAWPPAAPVQAQGPAMEFLLEQMRQRDIERRRAVDAQQRRREGQARWRSDQQRRERARAARPVNPAARAAPEISDRSPTVTELPRAANARRILVVGDEMADGLAQGLREGFAQEPAVAIAPVTRASRGLSFREPQLDLVVAAREALAGEPPMAAVIMLGMHDRRALTDGGRQVEFRSQRWRELYTARIEGLLRVFGDRGIPVYWIGLPAMRQREDASDAALINDIVKAATFAAGVKHLDTWEAFVDEEGRFLAVGPDMNGNPRRLRQADGIGLTPAGNRNLALAVETELRADLPIGAPLLAVVTPTEQPPRPAVQEVPRTFVGPVLPLHPPPTPARAELSGGGPRPPPGDDIVTRVLVRGEPPPRHAGRADDFRWQREERVAEPAAPDAQLTAERAPSRH
jgi:hypothetical protein